MAAHWWHEGELAVQRRAGVNDQERLRMGVRDELPPHFIAFLAAQRFLVVSTIDAAETLWCAMVPGWPGFAIARSTRQIAIEARAFEEAVLGQLRADRRIGLLAFDPSTRRRIRVNGTASIQSEAVVVDIIETFGNCQQYIQKRPASGPQGSAREIVAAGGALTASQQDWIATADTCFLGSIHPAAGPDASHRGGRPGFIEVLDERTLRFEDYPGNDMFQTLGNLTAHRGAAMLFVNFDTGGTLQLAGEADVLWNGDRALTGRAVRFRVRTAIEKRPSTVWSWPVLEYSPVNP
jgi:predicted pyridoxine 5'-phosphate oxidase superfamily flavin-nucleotide-binding protein